MNESLEKVKQFHEMFEHPIGELDTLEPKKIRQLRIKLLFEELMELAEASDVVRTFAELCDKASIDIAEKNGGLERNKEEYAADTANILNTRNIHDGNKVNKVEELDALCDIQYVLNGKILTSGLYKVFDREFDKVHQNNMAKAHRSEEHAEETLKRSLNGQGTIEAKRTYINSYVGYRTLYIVTNKDKKVIKPWDHKKVELNLY